MAAISRPAPTATSSNTSTQRSLSPRSSPGNGGILLGRRSISPGKGAWSFPSGYVNRGEKLEEAAAREVWEEINLRVRINRLVGVYSQAGQAVILVVYAADIIEGEPVAADEMSEVAAFPPEQLPTHGVRP